MTDKELLHELSKKSRATCVNLLKKLSNVSPNGGKSPFDAVGDMIEKEIHKEAMKLHTTPTYQELHDFAIHFMNYSKQPNDQRTKPAIEKAVIQEWKWFLESDEFQHSTECGTLLLAQHFAEWGRVNPRLENE